MSRRLAVLPALAAVALALAGTALANPTTPILHAPPATVVPEAFGTYTVSWDASRFELGYAGYGYHLSVRSYAPGESPQSTFAKSLPDSATSATFAVSPGRQYVVEIDAFEWKYVWGCTHWGWTCTSWGLVPYYVLSDTDAKEFDVVSPTVRI